MDELKIKQRRVMLGIKINCWFKATLLCFLGLSVSLAGLAGLLSFGSLGLLIGVGVAAFLAALIWNGKYITT